MLRRLVISFLLFPFFVSAQEPDTIGLLRSFKFTYENDLFTRTDYYYTGGTFFELNLPCFKRSPISKILLKLSNSRDESFGMGIANLGFSPTSINSDSILFGDRPFSATLYVGFKRVSCNAIKQMRLISNLDLGCIGPAAFGFETQKFIHSHTNNPIPHGWEFQIKNDLIINYYLKIEKGLLAKKRFFDFVAHGFVNAGTIYNNAGIGLTGYIGRMNHYFIPPGFSKQLQCWAFGRAEGKLIAHDATLQGGFFNTKSVYIIAPENMERTTLSCSAGIVFAYRTVRFEIYDTILSPEFQNGRTHAWGHLSLEILF